jgi:hypothetical protein
LTLRATLQGFARSLHKNDEKTSGFLTLRFVEVGAVPRWCVMVAPFLQAWSSMAALFGTPPAPKSGRAASSLFPRAPPMLQLCQAAMD